MDLFNFFKETDINELTEFETKPTLENNLIEAGKLLKQGHKKFVPQTIPIKPQIANLEHELQPPTPVIDKLSDLITHDTIQSFYSRDI